MKEPVATTVAIPKVQPAAAFCSRRKFRVSTSLNTIPVFILAGGVGERLAPLTEVKPKPAIPFGGTHQILDFTLSNCVNSGLRNIFVLTQYQRHHLHDYITRARLKLLQRFRWGVGEQILSLPPATGKKYRGTSEAVFQNLSLLPSTAEHVLIASGDHIYSMDYRPLLSRHATSGADMTMAAVRHSTDEASSFGVLDVDENHVVTRFREKPGRDTLPDSGDVLVSMGVYVFRKDCLVELAERATASETDFARHVVPELVRQQRTAAYDFGHSPQSYWRDVGTLDSYFRANMDLLGSQPKFDPDADARWPIFSLSDASSVNGDGSRISRGAVIGTCIIRDSIVSQASRIDSGSIVEKSIVLPRAHVGRGVRLRKAIVAEGVRIGNGAEIGFNSERDRERFPVTPEGIVIVKADVEASQGRLPNRLNVHAQTA